MKPAEILKLVEFLHREKDIDKEIIFEAIETALLTAAKKRYGADRALSVEIERENGEIHATDEYGDELDLTEFGRIAAQTAKQVIIQKLREEERNVIFDDFERRKDDIVLGTILRFEGPNLVINLGKTEGYLPKKEQVREERYQVGDRIRAYVKEVKKVGSRVRIILTRTHENFIRRLFELEVPEIGQEVILINGIVREPGYRTKLAVSSCNPRVDCVGACVGVRGSRIKNIIDELSGEKIDIIRWDDNPEQLIKNALKPAEVIEVALDGDDRRATALVPNHQLSLAIGKRGLNVRLASRLAGWEIDILNQHQMRDRVRDTIQMLMSLPHLTEQMAGTLFDNNYKSLDDLVELGADQLSRLKGMDLEKAEDCISTIERLLEEAHEEAQLVSEETAEDQQPGDELPDESEKADEESVTDPAEKQFAGDEPLPEADNTTSNEPDEDAQAGGETAEDNGEVEDKTVRESAKAPIAEIQPEESQSPTAD